MKKYVSTRLFALSLGFVALSSFAAVDNTANDLTANADVVITLQQAIAASPEQAEVLIATAIDDACRCNALANCSDSVVVEELLSAAIQAVGSDSDMIPGILATATTSPCIDGDTVTVIAVANNVDPTIASQATAAGPATTPISPSINTQTGNSGGGGISEIGL